jgi:predicted kinase
MLIVLSGLPGSGKTTIAKVLVAKSAACYVRIDEIEHALKQQDPKRDIGPEGYLVAYAIASSNLQLGKSVVVDCVNPVPESRNGWRKVAQGVAGTRIMEVEVICSDPAEHRRRMEARQADIADFRLPDWNEVKTLDYVPWTEPRLVIDTAKRGIADAVAAIETAMTEIP